MQVRISVTGIVQGVGFRPFVYRTAVSKNLRGYVKNRGDAGVEILLEGSRKAVDAFLDELREKHPPLVQIHQIITKKLDDREEFSAFTIHKSSRKVELSGSVIPPDIAICNDCLLEFRDSENPRHDYFFITCTNCGPRFTIIERLPYDRQNTTMQDFPLCGFCAREYADPMNRRFHAQTIACPECGPEVLLTERKGETVKTEDPARTAGKLLSEGCVLAIKGYGGFHVATSTVIDKPLRKLRSVKHRSQKPFAIMARDVETARTFAKVSSAETQLLNYYSRPIVLLDKNDDYYLSDLIAPDLHNLGVMLPYTGLHYMLFDGVKDPAFVMTSANPPNQPIINDNREALKALGNTVDYFLFHNRRIAHRCDDSVLRMHGEKPVFIRRSRGYAPTPIRLKRKTRCCVLSLGGELNNTACVLNEGRAFISQHVGDVENVETRRFLEEATTHLIRLTNSHVEAVACDLHPRFTTTALARILAEENGWPLFQVQHHYAHAAALMAEHAVEASVCICCDGYGYGDDGQAWGGEVLLSTQEEFGFRRLAHLESQPLIGGDLATRFPLRLAAGMLSKRNDVKDWLLQNADRFPHGTEEIQVILNQIEQRHRIVETTSCGRVLDAASAVLGLCYERTYEGEPAMKLESASIRGEDVLMLEPIVKGNILDTTELLSGIYENRRKYSVKDLAHSAHVYIAKGLAMMALKAAREESVENIGFSGGVACNRTLASMIRRSVEAAGFRFLVHEAVPAGDGGVSFGQAVAVGFSDLSP